MRCKHPNHDGRSIFCPDCGREVVSGTLRTVRPMGFVGVAHSTSPKIEKFFATGDPAVFDRP